MKKRLILILFLILSIVVTGFSYTGFFISDFNAEIDPGIKVIDIGFRNIGSSTNFLYMNDTELESVENMVLEDEINGKIYFTNIINLTKDISGGMIDLTKNVKILNNYISIDSMALKSLNDSAIIYLNNLEFNSPVVVKNGIICPITECEILSYIGGTLTFRVDSFSYYTIIENPNLNAESPPGGSSSSTNDVTTVIYDTISSESSTKNIFYVNKEYLDLKVSQGESSNISFNVENLYNGTIVVEVSLSKSLENFMKIKSPYVIVENKELKEFILDFNIDNNTIPGIYSGAIYLESAGIVKRVDILFEVLRNKALFDIIVDVDHDFKIGDPILADIYLFNLGNSSGIYSNIYYAIKDFEGNILAFKEDRIYIEKEVNLKKSLRFSNFDLGERYIFYAEIKYDNVSAFGYDTFVVNKYNIGAIINIIIILILSFIIIWLLLRKNSSKNRVVKSRKRKKKN